MNLCINFVNFIGYQLSISLSNCVNCILKQGWHFTRRVIVYVLSNYLPVENVQNVQNFQKRWKTRFSKETVKNWFGGTFNYFLGKGGVLPQKLTWPFLSQIRWIFYYLAIFSKKKKNYFQRKRWKTIFRVEFLLKGKMYVAKKMNVSFFIRNEVWNIFSFNNFFEESNIFWENCEKKFWVGYNHFLGDGVLLCQN